MLKIEDSVGLEGTNRVQDVRAVQQILLQLSLLAPAAFVEECLDLTVVKPVQAIKNQLLRRKTDVQKALEALSVGSDTLQVGQIRATIRAIESFQRKQMGMDNPDGTVLPNRKTHKQINKVLREKKRGTSSSASLRAATNPSSDFDLNIHQGRIQLDVRLKGQRRTKHFNIADARSYITRKYNWNAIIKLMKATYERCADIYTPSTKLSGTNSDDLLLIPDQGIAYVIELQLKHALKTQGSLDNILSSVDARPGENFLDKILKKGKHLGFLNEVSNKSVKRLEDNSKIEIPNSHDDEKLIYHFCRDIVRARHGAWSDLPGVCNIVGFRRIMDTNQVTHFNDTIAVCWLESNGKERIELNIATTEPGNKSANNQLAPQTLTLLPGYHINRQPAGRTHAGLKHMKDGSFTWVPGDTTMNFHQGKNNFKYPRNNWLTIHGFTGELKTGVPKAGMDAKDVLNLNLLLSELYLIFSKYGNDESRSCYTNLKNWAAAAPITKESSGNGKVVLAQKIGSKVHRKTIDLQKAKTWMLNTWYRKREKNRQKILDILHAITDYSDDKIASWQKVPKEVIEPFIKLEHIEKVVDIQAMHVADIRDKRLDGLGGDGFVEMLRGIYQPITHASAHKARVDELLEKLNEFPLKNVSGLQSKLKRLSINTIVDRRGVLMNTAYDAVDDIPHIEHLTVGRSSEGCQVIYDTEVFYTFWTKLLQRSVVVGQCRWYYTLIETTRFKKSSIV
ncbi:MAG: hypothetical protein AAF990_24460 [Bacteroidota bacterium]